jgi:ribonuclease T1
MKPGLLKTIFVLLLVLSAVFTLTQFTGCSDTSSDSKPSISGPSYSTQTPSSTQVITSQKSDVISIHDLSPEGKATLQLIKSGGHFRYQKDGSVFNNFEGLLPQKPPGYYHEYTVDTPGSTDRGARRIVTGYQGEYYYTEDHYNSFRRIQE